MEFIWSVTLWWKIRNILLHDICLPLIRISHKDLSMYLKNKSIRCLVDSSNFLPWFRIRGLCLFTNRCLTEIVLKVFEPYLFLGATNLWKRTGALYFLAIPQNGILMICHLRDNKKKLVTFCSAFFPRVWPSTPSPAKKKMLKLDTACYIAMLLQLHSIYSNLEDLLTTHYFRII